MKRFTVVNKDTFEVFIVQNIESYPVINWLINPEGLSAMSSVDRKFWKMNYESTDIEEMTQEEKDIILYNELEELKLKKIDELWNACYDYQNLFFNEPIWTKIMQMQLQGDTRAAEIDVWTNGLWGNYYTRRYMLNRMTDINEVKSASLSFESYGEPPYRVYELLGVSL